MSGKEISGKEITDILKKSGCYDFIMKAAEEALSDLSASCPGIASLLTPEACDCIKDCFFDRLELIYSQSLIREVRRKAARIDPVGDLLGRLRADAMREAAGALYQETGGAVEAMLHEKYPLIPGYRECIVQNFIGFMSEFFSAFLSKKEEISERFFDGRPTGRLLHLSTGGADVHRSGRCVIGVKSEAGTVYYKPHDCALDMLYAKIVARLFSDCTIAPEVIPGDGYAFVSCLQHESVDDIRGIARYFRNFGILSALYHGLGSIDMHYENILSCGDKPACVDLETILGTAEKADRKTETEPELYASAETNESMSESFSVFTDSVLRIGFMPVRKSGEPLFSPFYHVSSKELCLPEYEGRLYTIEGYEEVFRQGFHEGYARMLAHRDEIIQLIRSCSDAAVRCLLRNTYFYAIIRNMLFEPDHLTGEQARNAVYKKLCSPYTAFDIDVDPDITGYEWRCLLQGDIPYFCSGADSRDLCGSDPGQIVKAGYYRTGIVDSVIRFLNRLSEPEESFEQELIRVLFSHPPVDVEKEPETEIIPCETPEPWRLKNELEDIFVSLLDDAIRDADGRLYWMSAAMTLHSLKTCGHAALYADAGIFLAALVRSNLLPERRAEAVQLMETLCSQISSEADLWEKSSDKSMLSAMPVGLFAGFGGLILSCREMAKAGISGAHTLCTRIVRLSIQGDPVHSRKITLAEGLAGLILALSGPCPDEENAACVRLCADRLLTEELPDRADLPYGCAGIGMALAAAYEGLPDKKYADGALKAFRKVMDTHSEKLGGWADASAKIRCLTDAGPHAAGIYLAADYAFERLKDIPDARILSTLRKTALEHMLAQKTLYDSDTLNDGNALLVLALHRAGQAAHAGNVLYSVLERKKQKGAFAVAPGGIRSGFDPSLYMGTPGIAYVICNNAL